MKKIYAIALLSLVVLFSSCELQKRHYRNGYYVNWNNSKHEAATPATETAKATLAENTEAVVTTIEETQAATTSPNTSVFVPQVSESAADVPASNTEEPVTVQPSQEIATPIIKQRNSPVSENPPVQNSGDEETILLVILALLIPPLAVYLHEGSWNGTCWLNLILTLLFFIPGVIHALIVILS